MPKISLQSLKNQIDRIEQEGFLENCWIEQFKPGGTARGQGTYYHLRSKEILPSGKKTLYIKKNDLEKFQTLVANGRSRKKLQRQIAQQTLKSKSSREALTSSASNEWYTPPQYVDLARAVMGNIDLDPASNALAQQWIRADKFYTVLDNGLQKPWFGRIWLNPPYGSHTALWIEKSISGYQAKETEQAILLVKPAVGTQWYQRLSREFPECKPDKRIRFLNANGIEQKSPVHGNSFFYLGPDIGKFRQIFSAIGSVTAPYQKTGMNSEMLNTLKTGGAGG